MKLHLRPALDFDLTTLADLFTRGFEGYFVPITETAHGLAARLRYDTIDLALSQVALVDDRACGLIFVSVRGWECRIAGMGVATEARRLGIGRRLMEDVIELCRSAGQQRIILEVIEENEPAAALYRSLGFEPVRRLVGYSLPEKSTSALAEEGRRDAEALSAIDPREVGRQIATEADPDLPWQLAAETFSTGSSNLTGRQLQGKAFALTSGVRHGTIVLEALVVPRSERRSGWGKRMIQALASHHEGKDWRVPARVPEDLADTFLARLGFQKNPLTQREMTLDL